MAERQAHAAACESEGYKILIGAKSEMCSSTWNGAREQHLRPGLQDALIALSIACDYPRGFQVVLLEPLYPRPIRRDVRTTCVLTRAAHSPYSGVVHKRFSSHWEKRKARWYGAPFVFLTK
jgi:hypothetical protein